MVERQNRAGRVGRGGNCCRRSAHCTGNKIDRQTVYMGHTIQTAALTKNPMHIAVLSRILDNTMSKYGYFVKNSRISKRNKMAICNGDYRKVRMQSETGNTAALTKIPCMHNLIIQQVIKNW